MGSVFDSLKPRKSIEELEEEKEHNEAEISLLEQEVMKKELKKKGAELSAFKGADGQPVWARIKNWLSTH